MLLISQLPEDFAFATIVARTAGLELRHVQEPKAGMAILQAEESKAIFVDVSDEQRYGLFEAAIQETIGLFSDRIHPNAIHFITPLTIDQVPYLIKSPLFGNLLLRRFEFMEEAAGHYGRIVAVTQQERAWTLEKLLKPGTKVQTVKLVTSDQKQNAVDAIKNYIIAARFQTRMATLVANAIDEILMNAMFDAPVDELGGTLYHNTPRSASLRLEGRHSVEVQVGFDGTYVGITAIDHFGSLNKAKLLAHVSKVYTSEEYKVKTTNAGAGIGLATVYRTGGSFFFASESRERTEVTVFFKRTDSYRQFKEQFRFFSTQFYF